MVCAVSGAAIAIAKRGSNRFFKGRERGVNGDIAKDSSLTRKLEKGEEENHGFYVFFLSRASQVVRIVT